MCILSNIVKLCGLEKAQFLIKETFIASHFKGFHEIERRQEAEALLSVVLLLLPNSTTLNEKVKK